MEVTRVSVSPNRGCPGDMIDISVTVSYGWFESGTVNVYGRDGSGPWIYVCQIPGVGGNVGGEVTVSARASLPGRSTEAYWFGAKASTEPNPTSPTKMASVVRPVQDNGTAGASPLSGSAPLTVTLGVTGFFNASDIKWSFGDGSTGRGRTVTHTYYTAGRYVPIATPIDRCGDEYYSQYTAGPIIVGEPRCKNPDGGPGEFSCKGTTRVRCTDGQWLIYKENSPECGYVPPPKRCTDPPGAHGSYDCDGTTRIKCNDGRWETYERNSKECGYVAPPPPPPVYADCEDSTGIVKHGEFGCQGTTKVRCNDGYWVTVEHNSDYCRDNEPPSPTYRDCSNPRAAHGETRCDVFKLYECDDGTWKFIEDNSEECGYVPPVKGCENPPGADGATRCIETTRYKCKNQKWVVDLPNAPECAIPGGCTNPTGTAGQYRCDDTTRLQCTGGEWVVVERNSPYCQEDLPSPPPGTGCTNPAGGTGDIYCREDRTLMRCNGTEWLVQEYNSKQCQPPGTDPGQGQSPWPFPIDDDKYYLYIGLGIVAAFGLGALLSR